MPEILEVLVFVNYAGGRTVQGRNAMLKIASRTAGYKQHLHVLNATPWVPGLLWCSRQWPEAGARQDGGSAACIDGMRRAGEATVKLQKPYHQAAGYGEHIALVAAG